MIVCASGNLSPAGERWISSGLGRRRLLTSLPACLGVRCPATGDVPGHAFSQTFSPTTQADRRSHLSQGSFKAGGGFLSLKTKLSLLWRKRSSPVLGRKQKPTSWPLAFPFATPPPWTKRSRCLGGQTLANFTRRLPRAIFSTAEACHAVSHPPAAGQGTSLTSPAAAPASPHGTRSGSPGRSGRLLSPQMPPAAGLEPAPLAYLRGWDAPCVSQPRSFPESPLNAL